MNSLKVTFLLLLMTLLFVGIGYLFGGQGGMMIAFGLAVAMNFFSYWFSDKIVLRLYSARAADEKTDSRLIRITRAASLKASLPMPKVYVLPTEAPNAFATGRNPEHAAVAATEGILRILSDDELEGVIGHELGHVKNRDILIGTIAATLAGAIGIVATMARWAAIFGGVGGRSDDRGGSSPIALLVMAIVAPLAAMLIQMAVSRSREYKADESSARITGKPLSLASALQKLHKSPVQLNLDNRPATAHLFIANPLSGKGIANLFSTHPPMEERVKRLQAMVGMPIS
jgi:heat shock protein HtpX